MASGSALARPPSRQNAGGARAATAKEVDVSAMKTWTVEILIGELDGRTEAEAQLYDEIRDDLIGAGQARVGPEDPNIPEIGDEIAVARALSDLGHRLMVVAAGDLEDATHRRVSLHT